jgi:hypothetical protein
VDEVVRWIEKLIFGKKFDSISIKNDSMLSKYTSNRFEVDEDTLSLPLTPENLRICTDHINLYAGPSFWVHSGTWSHAESYIGIIAVLDGDAVIALEVAENCDGCD